MAFLCLQKEFFQDDVYSDTAVWWEPALTGSAWLSGSNDQHKKISLKPKDMTPGAGNDTKHIHTCPYLACLSLQIKILTSTVCVSALDMSWYVYSPSSSEWGPQRGSSEEIPSLICLPGGKNWWTEERRGEKKLKYCILLFRIDLQSLSI